MRGKRPPKLYRTGNPYRREDLLEAIAGRTINLYPNHYRRKLGMANWGRASRRRFGNLRGRPPSFGARRGIKRRDMWGRFR